MSKPTSSTGRCVGRALRRRFEQAGRKAVARRRPASCWPPCSRCRWSSSPKPRCAPSCGTWSAKAASASLASVAAHVVVDRQVAVRRGEHAGQPVGVAAGRGHAGGRDLERQRHRVGRAAALGRRAAAAARPLGGGRSARLRRGTPRARRPSPAVRRPECGAFDEEGRWMRRSASGQLRCPSPRAVEDQHAVVAAEAERVAAARAARRRAPARGGSAARRPDRACRC